MVTRCALGRALSAFSRAVADLARKAGIKPQ